MAVFVEMQTDAFRDVLLDLSERSFDFVNVRRPFRGIEIKEDTYAVLKVIRSDGREIPLFDAGSRVGLSSLSQRPVADASGRNFRFESPPEGTTFNYSNFIAEGITEARQEKSQIVENFGDPYIFFFGERPRIVEVSGQLVNTLDFNWKNEFWRNYEKYLRGTRLVELDARIYLYYDDQIVEGYMLEARAQHVANLPYQIPFSFTLFVTAHTYLGQVESSGLYPVSKSVDLAPDNLRQIESFDTVIKSLRERANKLRPDDFISSLEDVRQAAIQATGGIPAQAMLKASMLSGLSNYEARTVVFYQNLKAYFYGRRTVVPRGVAGAEVNTGSALMANQATFSGEPPKRTLPLRSRISDNVDEYVGEITSPSQPGISSEEMLKRMNKNQADFEAMLLAELAQYGVDVTDPTPLQTLRNDVTHFIVKTAGEIDFAAGVVNGLTTGVQTRIQQISSVVSTIFGT